MTERRKCTICSHTFEPRRHTQRTCSADCSYEQRRRRNAANQRAKALGVVQGTCAVCGRPFETVKRNRKLCDSDTCRRSYYAAMKRTSTAAKRHPVQMIACLICGEPFVPDRKNALICANTDCRAQRKRDMANSLTRGRPTRGQAQRTCTVCESPFVGHVNAKVCSTRCRNLRKREQDRRRLGSELPRCIVCGAFMPEVLDFREHRYTCSQPCRKRALKRRNARSYAKPGRRERQVEAVRRRKETDPSYRETLAARDRTHHQRVAQRKMLAEVAHIASELSQRLETVSDATQPIPETEQ